MSTDPRSRGQAMAALQAQGLERGRGDPELLEEVARLREQLLNPSSERRPTPSINVGVRINKDAQIILRRFLVDLLEGGFENTQSEVFDVLLLLLEDPEVVSKVRGLLRKHYGR